MKTPARFLSLLLTTWLSAPLPLPAQGEAGVATLAAILDALDTRTADEALFRRALADPDSFVRRQAALGLGRLHDPSGLPLLAPILLDRDSLVQATALFATGLIGGQGAVPLLIGRARDPAPLPAVAALELVTALARVGGQAAGEFFQSVLAGEVWGGREDAPHLVQRAALESWRLGQWAPTSSLLGLARDPRENTRYGAIYSLARLKVTAAAGALTDAAGDKASPIRTLAARALSRAFADSARLEPGTTADVLVRLTRDLDAGVRIQALRTLGGYHDPRLAGKLLPLLEDQAPNVQVQAAMTLGETGGENTVRELARISGVSKGTFARRREALLGLARLDSAAFSTVAARLGTGADWRERAAVAEGWARVSAPALAPFLRDEDPRVVAAALQAWGERLEGPDPQYLQACRQLARHRDAAVRSVAADGIARGASASDLSLLVDMYDAASRDSFPEAAISALGGIVAIAAASPDGGEEVETAALARLERPGNHVVRRWAEEHWARAAERWGPAYPIESGRSFEEYRDIVRALQAGTDSSRYPKVRIDIGGLGLVELELFGPEAPLTVAHFLGLVDRRYFDGQRFHRVVPNFVVQTGDPRGDGWGGPGLSIRDEINRRRYGAYFAGMALSGPDTGGSQWFITLGPQPHLDGAYTLFGRVTDGFALVQRITQGDQVREHPAMNILPRGLPLLLTLLGLPFGSAGAQFYLLNENKVQYRRLEWQVLRGPRVDVYYYPAEAALAPVAMAYAEETYDALSLKFGHTVGVRIPLIMYASHTDFEQTNILPFTPPEGLLGVTDFLKRRVTLPFRGNMAEFRHTLRHEMVHVFQISLLYDRYQRSPRSSQTPVPLWWTEGLAELWSGGEDARDEMILRDLVLGGRLPRLQDLAYTAGGIVYPLGGRIHRWLADAYGDWRVASLYHELWRYESFPQAVAGIYGRSLEDLNEDFQVAMRRQYYAALEGRKSLPASARLLARPALKPTFAPGDSGGTVVYAAAGNGFITVEERPLDGGRATPLIASGRSTSIENLHAFDSRIDASRPGLLLFSSRFQDRDALVIFDRRWRKIVGRYQVPHLVSILSPVWEPGGSSVIFSGLAESGVSDLYRLRLPGGEVEHLTDDAYQDLDPSVSPDGTRIVFASDRTAGGLDDAVNLFVMDLGTRALRQVTSGHWVDETPRWIADDRILFSSSRDGVLNAFSMDTLGRGQRETAAWTGVFDAAPAGDRDALLVGGFHDLTLGVYLYPADSAAREERFEPVEPAPHGLWTWPEGASGDVASARGQPYRRKYTLDFAAGDFAYVPRVGTGQGVTFLVSDLLSDNLFYFNFSTFQGRRFQSLFDNISVLGLYLNQTRRTNWGVGLYRFKGNQYEGDYFPSYTENTTGAFGLLRYPLSRFARVEGQLSVEHSNRYDFTLPSPRREGWITSQYVSYVHDNALWTATGPIDGHILAISTGIASDFSNSRFDSYTTVVDARQYLRLGRRSALALRGLGYYSAGERPQRVNVGGTLGIRGYPLYGYIIGSRVWMLNAELRYPLLDYFTFGSPLGPLRFPEVQGAFFVDVGRASLFRDEHRALIGSYGTSFRMPLVPGFVLRVDWGRRFSDGAFRGYGLSARQQRRSFVQLFFGYNY